MATQPRSFKLLDEYDNSIGKAGSTFIKGRHAGMINYGLASEDDMELNVWKGVIIGIQGKQTGEFIYEIEVRVPANYPVSPPQVRFVSPKVAMPCVDAQGRVNLAKISPAFQWKPDLNIADCLMAIRTNMEDDGVCRASAQLGNQSY